MSLFSEQRRHVRVLLGESDKIGIESESLTQRSFRFRFLICGRVKTYERVEDNALAGRIGIESLARLNASWADAPCFVMA